MLSVSTSLAIGRAHQIANAAEQAERVYREDIARLEDIVSRQAEIIRMHEKMDAANSCSIAGYRAYTAYVCDNCESDKVESAVEAYVTACNAQADKLGAPHLRQKSRLQR